MCFWAGLLVEVVSKVMLIKNVHNQSFKPYHSAGILFCLHMTSVLLRDLILLCTHELIPLM